MIDIAEEKGVFASVIEGGKYKDVPLTVVGPCGTYYHEAALGMMKDYKEIINDPDTTPYDEALSCNDNDANSVINENNETSATNQSSIILLFEPQGGQRFLLTGDCSSQSLNISSDIYDLSKCILKVPHHGSKHNLTTGLIDKLQPIKSAICASGTKKHPNAGIVYWLSKYGNGYSTHKGEFYWSDAPTIHPATPLKSKQQ